MRRTAVLNIAGLTPALLRRMPRLADWAAGRTLASIRPAFPALSCAAQATYLTGTLPREHGIVGNGWYFRDECEIRFWRQSDALMQRPRIWDVARSIDPGFTCANLFWWCNMYSTADVWVAARPMCPAGGPNPDIHTHPPGLRGRLQREVGGFPLHDFWGPRTSIRSSAWIAEAAERVESLYRPTLSLVYLPHLDHCLQRRGPDGDGITADLSEMDDVAAGLIAFFERSGIRVIMLSEYGVCPVSREVPLNWYLRDEGFIAVREERGRELLDAGASRALAVVDHQVAHVYVRDSAEVRDVRALLDSVPGVDRVLTRQELQSVDHPRSGDVIAVAAPDAWFSYYYWHDERRAPDFARTVDVHRKPGYDPAELFLDPAIPFPRLRMAWRQLRERLGGLGSQVGVTPLHGALVRGSHGRPDATEAEGPLLAGDLPLGGRLNATDVRDVLLRSVFDRHDLFAHGSRRAA